MLVTLINLGLWSTCVHVVYNMHANCMINICAICNQRVCILWSPCVNFLITCLHFVIKVLANFVINGHAFCDQHVCVSWSTCLNFVINMHAICFQRVDILWLTRVHFLINMSAFCDQRACILWSTCLQILCSTWVHFVINECLHFGINARAVCDLFHLINTCSLKYNNKTVGKPSKVFFNEKVYIYTIYFVYERANRIWINGAQYCHNGVL
jgi:hypothetical protein